EELAEGREKLDTLEDAQKYFKKIASKVTNYLNDSKEFLKIKKGLRLEKLIPVSIENNSGLYIDKDKFEFKTVDVIQLDSTKKKFVLLNHQKTIQFDSLINYDTVKLAEAGFNDLLVLLTSMDNYSSDAGTQPNEFKINIKTGENLVAVYFQSYKSEEEADNKIKEIFNDIISQTYKLSISDPIPDNWEFKYQLIDPAGNNIEFVTRSSYKSEQNARDAAQQFYGNISALKIRHVQNEMQLVFDDKKKIVAYANLAGEQLPEKIAAATQLLQYHKDLSSSVNNPSKKIIDATLETGRDSTFEQYVYKLVDKDNLLARFPVVADTNAVALSYKNDLITKAATGYKYIGISFGWDIIDERKDAATNAIWYHYRIQCNNFFYKSGELKDHPLVLFESIKGYSSSENAMQAFLDNYLIILRAAHLDTNYGVNQTISLAEILIHEEDDCIESESNVFIPAATLYEYGGDPTVVIKAIILLAKSYPILCISTGRYRFVLFNAEKETYDWRSIQWFATPQEAMQQFLYFLSLLGYSGNFYIENDETDCRFHIYIREVLAISVRGFVSPSDAWGKDGVEKFICVAQSEDGFHNYLNRENCSHSFYVACGNTSLIHPCKYETPERRDNVLNKLYKAASFNFFDLLQLDDKNDEKNSVSLLDLNQKPLANFYINRCNQTFFDPCEKLIEIFEAIYIDSNYVQQGSNFYLADVDKNKIADPAAPGISLTDWKQQLLAVSCYFPLFRQGGTAATFSTGNQRQCNYFIRIKLPAFDICADDMAMTDPVCENLDEACKPNCYIAWRSDCCFGSCCEALQFYAGALKLIAGFGNYKPTYECDCGYYGIELHADEVDTTDANTANKSAVVAGAVSIQQWLCVNNQNPDGGNANDNQNDFTNLCLSDIVAINPQQYNSASIACDAVERAKKLINSEGLHLAEHILLRPRCENTDHVFEECSCQYLPQLCIASPAGANANICRFEWKPGGDADPCVTGETICFTPGCDPYSFIATVALPAWPQRFRSEENRTVIENLLQKEAPAHVLLRILWLKPRDFCCFETYFKNWNYWLAKKMCDTQYSNCDFLGLLFNKNFDPLDDCAECLPCTCNDAPPASCFSEEKIDCPGFDLVTQINKLYCWDRNSYDTYGCEIYDYVEDPIPVLKAPVTSKKALPKTKDSASKKETADKDVTPQKVAIPQKTAILQKEKTPEVTEVDSREKYLTIQARSAKYNENVKKVVDAKPGNKVAENALRFLADANPEPERYDDLVNKILKNKSDKPKNIKGLTLKEKNGLIDNISWQYFDRICLNEKKTGKITMHHALFNHLRKNKIDMNHLYNDWNSKEIKAVEPEINLNEIKKVVV
nr:hypothetical protein [Bacteroidota bacterium]